MPKVGEIFIEIFAKNQKLKGGLSQASSLIRDWSLVATGLTQGVTNAFRTIASVGIKAVTVSLAGLTAAFVLTAKSGAEFEDNMVRTFAILRESSGATQGDMAALTAEARRLGRDTLASGTMAAEGMMVLARAGFDVSETLTATKSVVDLSIVGNMSVAESASAAASAMRGFGLEAADLGRVNDVLAKASALANTDIRLLSSGLSFVAPLSRAAGISLEETATALDVLANAGIRGSRGGTTLRRMLSVLLAPTGRAKEAFDEMGLSFTNAEGKIDSMSSVLKKLEKQGLTAAQTMEIFGLRAGPGVAALLGAGTSAFEKLKGQIQDSQGASDRMSQELRTSVAGRVKDLSASVKELGLAFSEQFKKPLADTIFGIRTWLISITSALQKTGIFKAIVKGVIAVLSPLTDRIKAMAASFKELAQGLTAGGIAEFFETLKSKVTVFFETVEEHKESFMEFFTGAKDAVSVFIIPVINLVKKFGSLNEGTQKLIARIVGFSAALLFLVGGIVPLLSNLVILSFLFKGTWVLLGQFTSMVMAGIPINTAFSLTLTQMKLGLIAAAKAVGRLFLVFIKWIAIAAGVVAAIALISATLRGLFEFVKSGFKKGSFGEGFKDQMDVMKKAAIGMADFIPKKFKDMFSKINKESKEGKAFEGLTDAANSGVAASVSGNNISGEEKKNEPITIDGVTYRSKSGIAAAKKALARRKKGKVVAPISRLLSQGIGKAGDSANEMLFQQQIAMVKKLGASAQETRLHISDLQKQFNTSEAEIKSNRSKRGKGTAAPRNGFLDENTSQRVMAGMGIFPIGGIGPSDQTNIFGRDVSGVDNTTESGILKNITEGLQGKNIEGISNEQSNMIMLQESLLNITTENRAKQLENNAALLSFLNKMVEQGQLTQGDLNAAGKHLSDLQSKQGSKTGKDDITTQSNTGNGLGIQPK